jgi:hypothetical protein
MMVREAAFESVEALAPSERTPVMAGCREV